MSDPAQQRSRPKVNDGYWFNLSEDLVGKSLGAHEAAAGKLQTLVLWLWGVYTTYATVGLTLAGKSLPLWAALVIALGSAALIGVYWATFWVQAPVASEFDARSPDDIRYAFREILETRRKRFSLTLAGSVAAAFLVVLALIVASTVKPELPAATPSLKAELIEAAEGPQLAVLARVDKGVSARLRVESGPDRPGQPAIERAVLASDDGIVQASFAIDPSVGVARVSVEWPSKDGMRQSMSREVKKAKTS